jgi:hypothetical protein
MGTEERMIQILTKNLKSLQNFKLENQKPKKNFSENILNLGAEIFDESPELIFIVEKIPMRISPENSFLSRVDSIYRMTVPRCRLIESIITDSSSEESSHGSSNL